MKTKTVEDKNEKEKKQENENENEIEQTLFWQCQNCPENIHINFVQNITDFQKITKHIYVHSRKNERYSYFGCGVSRSNFDYLVLKKVE